MEDPGATAAATITTRTTAVNEENNDDRNIGVYGKEEDDGGGGMRGSNNCNVNVGSENSGMRRGGKGSLPIPAASATLPLFPLQLSPSASVSAQSGPITVAVAAGGMEWKIRGRRRPRQ